jgi:hypothetical protein
LPHKQLHRQGETALIEWLWLFYSSGAGRTVGDALRLLSSPPAQVSVRARQRLEQKMMRYCKTRKVDAMMYQHTLLETKSKREMSEVDRVEMEKD